MEDCARAEKQKRLPLLMDPNARAKNEVKTAAEISKTLLYKSDFGATISWRKPRMQPKRYATGRSIRRASNAVLLLARDQLKQLGNN